MTRPAAPIDLEVPVVVYTDGACIPNPGPGGWGYYMCRGPHKRDLWGPVQATTNNRMELQAVIEALSVIKKGSLVEVVTDSQYVKDGMTKWIKNWKANGWRTSHGKPVKNEDLWRRLDEQVERHSGDPGNERADALASKAAQQAGRMDTAIRSAAST